MKRYCLLLLVLIYACGNADLGKKASTLPKLLGDWDYTITLPPGAAPNKIITHGRLAFVNDSLLEDAVGFFEKRPKTTLVDVSRKYRYERAGAFEVYNNETRQWELYLIKKFESDTLIIAPNGVEMLLTRAKMVTHFPFVFDEVVLNTYPCHGGCPIMAISIHKNGEVFYQDISPRLQGKEAIFYKSTANKVLWESIQRRVQRANIPLLKSIYGNESDEYNMIVSFYNNGKEIKTISDTGVSSTKEFFWLYSFLVHVPDILQLQEVKPADYQTKFERLDNNTINKMKRMVGRLKNK